MKIGHLPTATTTLLFEVDIPTVGLKAAAVTDSKVLLLGLSGIGVVLILLGVICRQFTISDIVGGHDRT